jgi:hypothetical protein
VNIFIDDGGGGGGSSTTWNSADSTAQWLPLTNGDLTATWTGSGLGSIRSTVGSAGANKVVWAVRVVSFTAGVFYAGLTSAAQSISSIGSPYLLIQTDGSTIQAGGSGSGATLAAMSANDIYMFAQDGATGETWVGKGGTWSGDPGAGTGEAYTFTSPTDFMALLQSFNNAQVDMLVGANYPYSLPSGFASL